ncbi:MAG: transporter substrate-binding domain-containing protein [Gordonia sp. (in: high G+C Gram-positive bacteria)]|uniref:transporter substrate-binding domain-containing protein n=1 Tax=Gordonia sp. (in: high G+C Gram-positive bacteria) TaxID=84139 RepID=UPI0039E3EED7
MTRLLRRVVGAVAALLIVALSALSPGMVGPVHAAPGAPRDVKVAIHQVIPFVNPMVPGQQPTGFSIDLWDEIAQRNNWNTIWVDTPDVKGQLAAVTDGQADTAVGAVSITAKRTQDFDFTQPFFNAGLQILVPASNKHEGPSLVGFLKLLFTWQMLVWLATAALLGLVPAFLYWLTERRHPDSDVDRDFFPGIFQSYRRMIGSLVGAGEASPRHPLTIVLVILWAFVAIIFTSFYTANLSADLTVKSLDSEIQSPQDLAGKTVAGLEGSTGDDYLKTLGLGMKYYPNNRAAMEAVRDGVVDAAVLDAPVEQYYASHDGAGKVQTTGTIFEPEDYGFPFKVGDDLRRQVDNALLGIREDGTYDRLKTGWFGDENSTADGGGN